MMCAVERAISVELRVQLASNNAAACSNFALPDHLLQYPDYSPK